MGLNTTTFDAALKVHYTPQRVVDLSYKDHTLMALMSKYTKWGGKKTSSLPIPIRYARTQGRSRTFATAQSIAAGTGTYLRVEDFLLSRVADYAVAQIDGETMDASMGDANAFMEAASSEIDSAFEQISASLAHALYRNGTGLLATCGSAGTGTTMTLATTNDVVHFEVGMVLSIFDDDGAGTAAVVDPTSIAAGTLTAVNRDTGVLTLGANWNTVFGGMTIASGSDGILAYGDGVADGSGDLTAVKVSGLDAWVPSSAPGSTAFFGVNRSVDPTRLGGVRSDGSSKDPESAYIDALTRVHREQGRANYFFVTYEDWSTLEKTLGSKVQYGQINLTPTIGFTGIRITSPKGEAYVIPDQDAIPSVAYGLDMRTWKLYSLGMAPRMLSRDGNRVLRIAAADGIEARIGYYGNLGCDAPGFNVRLALPS